VTDKYILLCEDNEDDVELTKLAFQKNGTSAKLVVIGNGEEAWISSLAKANMRIETLMKNQPWFSWI
jgi:hypothetical protein